MLMCSAGRVSSKLCTTAGLGQSELGTVPDPSFQDALRLPIFCSVLAWYESMLHCQPRPVSQCSDAPHTPSASAVPVRTKADRSAFPRLQIHHSSRVAV
jgi:hypothetical protein